ncbi:GMC oxidoreductase [Apiospora arundinis]|uniref:long-chain-alcohol oxidase n=1 Tax=Apiospora arundinis TaxID=335852 RepID=A0ABR2IAI8_9PEZI
MAEIPPTRPVEHHERRGSPFSPVCFMPEYVENSHSHIAVPISEAPPATFFDETQWRVLYALMDTVIPPITTGASDDNKTNGCKVVGIDSRQTISKDVFESHYEKMQSCLVTPPSREAFAAYLSERPSEIQDFRDHLVRTLVTLSPDARKQLGMVIYLLGTKFGSLALTGQTKPFYELTGDERESVLRSWRSSLVGALRGLAKSLTSIATKTWVQTSPLFRELSGYVDIPEDYEETKKKNHEEKPPAEYVFKQFYDYSSSSNGGHKQEATVVDTDVVIVGSGCGGAVCARVLAEAGHRVLVVEKGYYFPPSQLPMRSDTAETNLFLNKGVISTDDNSVSTVAGGTWGGGGSVNWGVSLQTPEYIRQDWASNRGLQFFNTPQFQFSLDRVCDFMGVSDAHVRQNHRGQVLLDGAAKLGWKAKVTPHNSGGRGHHCGHCHLGCGSSGKQGPAVSWLPAAARAGAEFIEGFEVDRIDFADFASGKKAEGVTGRWVSKDAQGGNSGPIHERTVREVVIKAKRVIVACGTLSSPLLLRKSGLANPQIGRNLYLHPVNLLGAFWNEDVNPMDGCAISSVCTTFENLDGQGHGVKLEGTCMVPYLIYSSYPATSGLDLKLKALRYRNLNAFICIPRDRDTGYVYPDPRTGQTRIDYTPSAFDRAHVLEGIVALARICRATGAEEIQPFLPDVPPFIVPDASSTSTNNVTHGREKAAEDERFEAWIRHIRRVGNPATTAPWACAHQMGSCRMSRTAEDGVVDSRGKVWEVAEGLYVADASVLPSATGVNPMVTTMATADWIARGIAADLDALRGLGSKSQGDGMNG